MLVELMKAYHLPSVSESAEFSYLISIFSQNFFHTNGRFLVYYIISKAI
ncbi:hypothetical protein KSF78_0003141 [Schistosoma japonicum]|nr:hypothetical protein KSF78_0003141 [Schistosoma japonicum]